MGASGEQVCGLSGNKAEPPFFQQCHIPGQGCRVTGDVDQAAGGHAVNCLDGIGVQTLSRRVHGDDIRADALLFQLQGGLARIAAEKLRVMDAVASGVVPGIGHRLLDDLHADDLARRAGHGQGDGAHAAVQVQNRVVFRDASLLNGGFIQPLGLMVVHLIKGSGGQTEIETAEGILNIAGAV